MATVQQTRITPRTEAGPFRNEPATDFSKAENARRMKDAIERVRAELGREYDLVIGDQRLRTERKIRSTNPARPSEVVGVHQRADASHVEPAMKAALGAFETWRHAPVAERAGLIFRAAELMRERKFELCAWLIFEVGKNWGEADADVAEAIDFAELYARTALELDKAQPLVQLPGERDSLRYLPLGVAAVIPPWNFPLAIMAGMTMAAVVTGNTVILKPSSESPTIAARFFEIMQEAGMPDGVVNFCPGGGADFGDAVVADPKTRFIAFTGSKEVGLHIHESAAKTRQSQVWIKRTILEMGGKDAIIVDADADLDAAVEGVAAAAFGFNGQKCSACSRLILDDKVYEPFLQRLVERVRRIKVGDPTENAPMGPVVSESAMNGILGYIDVGKKEGRVLAGGQRDRAAGDGWFIEPTIIADVAPTARLAQEEVFGPVLAVIRSRGFEDALAIANNTQFGLTGAVYTSSPEKIEIARRDFHVGNLYINRKCTGAMVGAHPFGGFNMSGTDSKAGGSDYLYLFTQAKSIGQKVV